jgi:hypothetical protein
VAITLVAGVSATTVAIWGNNGTQPNGNATAGILFNGTYSKSSVFNLNSYPRPSKGAVPVPGTLLLYGAGVAGFAAWRWLRNRRSSR